MKQKLGLACALLARPRLLLLDEPSVGVDPASRRELWAIVSTMLAEGQADGMGVIWATAYQDEAARCGQVLLLHQGVLLADAAPETFLRPLQGRVFRLAGETANRRAAARQASAHPAVLDAVVEGAGVRIVLRRDAAAPDAASLGGITLTPIAPRFEDGFLDAIAGSSQPAGQPPAAATPPAAGASRPDGTVIEVRDLVRRFGNFTAVQDVSFSVRTGEIFGLLGPNGAGKSTTFRMLCGLLRPSSGTARVAGQDLLRAPAEARARIGYMAQLFSLYGELSVLENLRFFARVYGLGRSARAAAIAQSLDRFELGGVADTVSAELPLGVKRRLALAAALLHGPDVLFLDEPTSGVDPLVRREFWARIGALADAGVAILVTSHFMDEAEYCDRLAIVDAGRLIATGTPASLRERVRTPDLPDPTLEDAFIALVAQSAAQQGGGMSALLRMRGLVRKEIKQILRDPSAILIAFLLPVVLMVVNGFGISFDARHMKLAVVVSAPDEMVRGLVQALAASPYLDPRSQPDMPAAELALARGDVRGILVVREDFNWRLRQRGATPAPLALDINATDPNSARLLEGYVSGALATWLAGEMGERRLTAAGGVDLQHRFWFNPELRSADAIIPGVIAMVMTMSGALLTALIVAREWERGTMESMLASPAAMGELILAKLGCYFLLGMGSMALAVVMAITVFGLPFRGSIAALAPAAALFMIFALSLGLFISTLARNQFVASQAAFLTTMLPAMMLSGMIFDIASMPHWLQILTYAVPARYLVSILQTLFLAGDIWPVLLPNMAGLAAAAALAVAATLAVTRRRLD